MAEQIQALIDAIKTDGIAAAEKRAKEIESQAQKRAEEIQAAAKKQAADLVVHAQAEIQKKEQASRMALTQAARDTVLSVHKNIEQMLSAIARTAVADTLTTETMAAIISAIVERALAADAQAALQVAVSPQRRDALVKSCVARLQGKLKDSVTFVVGDDIANGFSVSFDAGRSCFEFSDRNLAEYISNFLNAELAVIVKG